VKIAHITDLHMRKQLPGCAPETQRLSRKMPGLFERALECIARDKPDLLALTGDILDFPEHAVHDSRYLGWAEEDMQYIAERLNALPFPSAVLPGNHDPMQSFKRVFGTLPDDFMCEGYRMVSFYDEEHDFHIPRRILDERQKLNRVLDDGVPSPQVHLQHYIIWPELDKSYPLNYREAEHLQIQLSADDRIRLVLSGHYHAGIPLQKHNETWYATAPAFAEKPHQYCLYTISGDTVTEERRSVSGSSGPGKRKAIFLDRDGTISPLPSYYYGPERMELLPSVAQALARLKQAGYALVVVSNQSALGYGYVTRQIINEVNDTMAVRIRDESGVNLDGIYCSYTAPGAVLQEYRHEDHPDAKPNPGLLLRAAEDLGLDVSASVIIGDRKYDLETGKNAGTARILVKTGDGEKTAEMLQQGDADAVVNTLGEAVDWILSPPPKARDGE
jgi:D-glycero-D-manno-heptose 1,7-bisphosphate phosphatase